jgi:hypothetical protein
MRLGSLVLTALVVVGAGVAFGDRGALLAVLGIVLALLAALGLSVVGERADRLTPTHAPADNDRLATYDRIYSSVLLAATSERHRDLSLRPILLRVVAAELEDGGPATVQQRVGADWWHVLDPDRPPSGDSHAPGVTPAQLGALLDRWET